VLPVVLVAEWVHSVKPIIFPMDSDAVELVRNFVTYRLLIRYTCQISSPSAVKRFPSEKFLFCSHCTALNRALSDHWYAGLKTRIGCSVSHSTALTTLSSNRSSFT
jgi:hypothetical protein